MHVDVGHVQVSGNPSSGNGGQDRRAATQEPTTRQRDDSDPGLASRRDRFFATTTGAFSGHGRRWPISDFGQIDFGQFQCFTVFWPNFLNPQNPNPTPQPQTKTPKSGRGGPDILGPILRAPFILGLALLRLLWLSSKRVHWSCQALQTSPKFHEKTPQRDTKRAKWWRERNKKARNFAPHPSEETVFGQSVFGQYVCFSGFTICAARKGGALKGGNSNRAPPVLQTPPKFHEKTPRERQKERKWGVRGKKAQFFVRSGGGRVRKRRVQRKVGRTHNTHNTQHTRSTHATHTQHTDSTHTTHIGPKWQKH